MEDTSKQTIPDLPLSFGYKCIWIAVKTNDTQKVAKTLYFKNIEICNWKYGLNNYFEKYVFITPPVNEWIFVVGWGLPTIDSSLKMVYIFLNELSKEFGESFYFINYRVSGTFGWAKSINGEVKRIYACNSHDNIIIDQGDMCEFEKKLNLVNTSNIENWENDNSNIEWPDEETVMIIAENWSFSPENLENNIENKPDLGLLYKDKYFLLED